MFSMEAKAQVVESQSVSQSNWWFCREAGLLERLMPLPQASSQIVGVVKSVAKISWYQGAGVVGCLDTC